ncbi:MAG: hypothetical protein DRN96_09725 [Thermoproteota archaeon]|nr:MAG: hypothetical protein DRN96_09725 [Candidatus Korarchaeota archaeon]
MSSELDAARGRLTSSLIDIMAVFEAYSLVRGLIKAAKGLPEASREEKLRELSEKLEPVLSSCLADFLEALFYKGRVSQLAEDISKGFKPPREEVTYLSREVLRLCERVEERVSGAWRVLKPMLREVRGVEAHRHLK